MTVIKHSEITIAACGRCTTEMSRLRGERDAARATVERQAGEVIAVNLQLQGAVEELRALLHAADVEAQSQFEAPDRLREAILRADAWLTANGLQA